MTQPVDLDEHRKSLRDRIAALAKEIEHTAVGGHALAELARQLHVLVQNVEERMVLQGAELELFSKLVLANARLSNDFGEFKSRCLELEVKLGYFTPT
jgi:hypothetical protein